MDWDRRREKGIRGATTSCKILSGPIGATDIMDTKEITIITDIEAIMDITDITFIKAILDIPVIKVTMDITDITTITAIWKPSM